MGDAEKSKETLLAELRSLRRQGAELEAEHRIQTGATPPRKQAEEALQESHDLLHAVIEGTPDMIFAKDIDGRHTLMNTSACLRARSSRKRVRISRAVSSRSRR